MRLGTRASALALAQAGLVCARLEALGESVEVVQIVTGGDERPGGAPAPAPPTDKSRFVSDLERALLAGEIDLAVHSAKDVPAELPEGLAIAGVPERADARDTLCGATTLEELEQGAVVGTASLRRRAQLLAAWPELDVVETRGNVDTRLRKLGAGEYGALVLAQAGLDRLGRAGEGSPIDPALMTPAAGQGCLILETRAGDPAAAVAGRLTDTAALTALTAERALVGALDATCNTPVGAHATQRDGVLHVAAFVGTPDGATWIRDDLDGDPAHPADAGLDVAERLLAAGAREVLAAAEAAATE
jgi:hydroxymethylbilane synthase